MTSSPSTQSDGVPRLLEAFLAAAKLLLTGGKSSRQNVALVEEEVAFQPADAVAFIDQMAEPATKKPKHEHAAKKTADREDEQPPPVPTDVVLIARRNKRTHYFLPTKDATFCGVACPHVMIDSGCNTIQIPFPEVSSRAEALNPFANSIFQWTIAASGGTRAIHSPVLKISTAMESVGNMSFPAFGFQAPMPFLRFHLGSEESRWILENHARRIGSRGRQALNEFLKRLGGEAVDGRKIALLGQMLLQKVCVFQFGRVMYIMQQESTHKLLNPTQMAAECLAFADYHIADFDRFDDLHDSDIDLYDKDGDMPCEED